MIVAITGFVGDTLPPAVLEHDADNAILKDFDEENPFGSGRAVMYDTETIWPAGINMISDDGVIPMLILPLGNNAQVKRAPNESLH